MVASTLPKESPMQIPLFTLILIDLLLPICKIPQQTFARAHFKIGAGVERSARAIIGNS